MSTLLVLSLSILWVLTAYSFFELLNRLLVVNPQIAKRVTTHSLSGYPFYKDFRPSELLKSTFCRMTADRLTVKLQNYFWFSLLISMSVSLYFVYK